VGVKVKEVRHKQGELGIMEIGSQIIDEKDKKKCSEEKLKPGRQSPPSMTEKHGKRRQLQMKLGREYFALGKEVQSQTPRTDL